MATNYAKASYTEIIDLQTVKNKASVIGIHTPTGDSPYSKLKGFFTSFRKYRYKGIARLTMVPAAQLPVDPLGLTGIVGSTDLMDPRDNLNPIMFHGCHGESMDMILDRFYGNNGTGLGAQNILNPTSGYVSASADCMEDDLSFANIETRYYARLTDPTWKKFGIQSGVSLKRLHPLTWKLSQSQPLLPSSTGAYTGIRTENGGQNSNYITSNAPASGQNVAKTSVVGGVPSVSQVTDQGWVSVGTMPQVFTNGVARLGWMPTTTFGFSSSGVASKPSIVKLPKLFMGMLVLPPAYNVEQFFRLSIVHVFEFKDFTASLGAMADVNHPADGDSSTSGDIRNPSYYNWIQYTDPAKSEYKVIESDPIDEGTTLDVINGSSETVSDGVL